MKNISLPCILVILSAGCSTPKYTYYFDHYDYQSGRKAVEEKNEDRDDLIIDDIDINTMVASADEGLIISSERPSEGYVSSDGSEAIAVDKDYSAMSRAEKKSLRKELKRELKRYLNDSKKQASTAVAQAPAEMDRDLKLAIIFGAVGLTLSLFSGISAAFWVLGVIAIVVGVVFLIQWLVRQ